MSETDSLPAPGGSNEGDIEVATISHALAKATPAQREETLKRFEALIENRRSRDPEAYRAARRGLEIIRAAFVDPAPGQH